MCGPSNEELEEAGRLAQLCWEFDNCGENMDEQGNLLTLTAQKVAEILDTTPQVAGRIMRAFDDLWEQRIIRGRVTYVSRERR